MSAQQPCPEDLQHRLPRAFGAELELERSEGRIAFRCLSSIPHRSGPVRDVHALLTGG